MRNFVSIEKFRTLANENKVTEEIAIRAQYITEVKATDDNKRELLFSISTDSIDRSGDKINQDGWNLEAYRKNPVVLWAHDYSKPPIGMSDKTWIEGGKLKSITRFVPSDNAAIGRFAEGIYQLYKQGFMSAVSVGFIPKKWNFTEDKDRKYGIDFEEQELLEYSAVPVPANADALIEARGIGADVALILEWALETIFPKGINRRKFERFLSDSGFSQKEAVALASLSPKGLLQSDSEGQIREFMSSLGTFRESLK
jgi:HK97 family phage prohead protease